jgi:hypothetical protein
MWMVVSAVEGIDLFKIAGESISGMSSLRNESELSPYLFLIRFITSRSKDYFPAIACSFALPPAFSGTLVHEEQNNQRACEIGLLDCSLIAIIGSLRYTSSWHPFFSSM